METNSSAGGVPACQGAWSTASAKNLNRSGTDDVGVTGETSVEGLKGADPKKTESSTGTKATLKPKSEALTVVTDTLIMLGTIYGLTALTFAAMPIAPLLIGYALWKDKSSGAQGEAKGGIPGNGAANSVIPKDKDTDKDKDKQINREGNLTSFEPVDTQPPATMVSWPEVPTDEPEDSVQNKENVNSPSSEALELPASPSNDENLAPS